MRIGAEDGAGTNRNFEIFDPLDSLAAVTSRIPNALPLFDDTASAKVARGTWARILKKFFATDPPGRRETLLFPGLCRAGRGNEFQPAVLAAAGGPVAAKPVIAARRPGPAASGVDGCTAPGEGV